MKFLKSSVLFISMACIVPVCSIAREKSERITRAEIEQKSADEFINGLMSRMTVDEKIGQLNLPSYGNVMPNPKKSEIASRIVRGEVGGIFNIFGVDAIRQLQEVAVKESRLGIPIIVGADICNGYKTVFPIPLGLSCSWKPENIEEVARISAKEVGADGICWTYSPMVDIYHDARWGRVKEGAGEDPFLGGIMAQAWVRGYQGNDLSADTTLMACVKHYALYGAAEAGRDYNTVDMSRVTAMNYYMRPYQAAVEAGVGSIMTSFNEFESIPATGNTWLLNDVLRKQWGFNGFVVSDFTAIAEMVNHGIGNRQEVGVKALKAGVDMDMIADCYHAVLKKSLEEGKITEAEIDSACRRILIAKYQLGLFHDPYKYCNPKRAAKEFLSVNNVSAARRIAAESFVLLKNDNNLLPLKGCRKVAVVGPLADSKANMAGSWKYDEQTKSYHGLVEDLQESLGNGVEVVFAKGSNLVDDSVYEANFTDQNRSTRDDRSDEQLIAEALKVVEGADVIIAALGESIDMSGEGASRAILEMPQTQKKLLDAIQKTGKPIVLIDRKIQGIPCDSVLVDNKKAAEDAMHLFIEKGHRKIGIIGGPEGIFTAEERLEGYYTALKKAGISIKNSLVYRGDYTIQGGVRGLEQLVRENPDMTAVFVTNYEMTMGAMIGVNELGIQIPEQLSMIGFDNLQFARACRPKLTIVSQPTDRIAKEIARIILEHLEKKEERSEEPFMEKLQTEIMEGKSVSILNR